MEIPKDLLYTEEHEWVHVEDDVATVGITDYAQGELGDIIFVELPAVGDATKQMEPFGTIEAVKTVAELFAPLSGSIVEVNSLLQDQPEKINQDPYGEGWIVRIQIADKSELDSLLRAADYASLIK